MKRIPGSGAFLAKHASAPETGALGVGWTPLRACLFPLRIEASASTASLCTGAFTLSGLPTTPSRPLTISVPTASQAGVGLV